MDSNLPLTWLFLPAAVGLGALHALEPGHGKTLMSVFLAGNRATVRNAMTMGLVVTGTHTVVVIALALLSVLASSLVSVEAVQHQLRLLGALALCGMGVWMLIRQGRALAHGHPGPHGHSHAPWHAHDHNHGHGAHGHGHEHAHPHDHGVQDTEAAHVPNPRPAPSRDAPRRGLAFGEVFTMGFSAGLVPCPGAIAALVFGLSTGRPWMGLFTVLAFSIGVALTLIGVGVAVVLGARAAGKAIEGRARLTAFARYAPLASAVIVTILGALLVYRVWTREASHDHVGIDPPARGAVCVRLCLLTAEAVCP